MNITQIIKATTTELWALDITFAQQAAPALLNSLLSPKANDFEVAEISSVFKIVDRVATLQINGAMFKSDGLCAIGTETMSAILKSEANNFDCLFLEIDSPGGAVDGTAQLAQSIKVLNKPSLAFVSSGMACSAAYWIASAADEIYASSETDRVGSVGTVISFADMQPYWEAQGVKFHEIYASKSIAKNAAYKEARDGDYSKIRKELLDPINEFFIKSIKENRSEISPTAFEGNTYTAQNAIKLGLIDKISSRDAAYKYLSKKKKDYYKNENKNEMLSMTNLKQWLGFGQATQTDAGLEINSEGIETLEAKINELKAENSALAAKNTQLENDKAELNAALTDLKSQAAPVTQVETTEPETHKAAAAATNPYAGAIEALHASAKLPDWMEHI